MAMDWQAAKQIMIERGYVLQAELTTQSGVIQELRFTKDIPIEYELPLIVCAKVKTKNEACDSCWTVELFYIPFVGVEIHSADWLIKYPRFNEVEKVIISYANHCRNFDPLK